MSNETKTPNPLLDKVRMPGATFSLPSGGGFYTDGQVEFEIANKPEVYVSPMTTMDEIAITSLDKLLNGTAVLEVFERCIPAIKDATAMLSSDVDYLLVALRIVSFGKETDVVFNHECSDTAKPHTYVVNVEDQVLDKTKKLSKAALKQYSTDLSSGLHVEFQPLTYGGLLDVQDKLERLQTANEKRENAETRALKKLHVEEINDAAREYFITLMQHTVKSMDGYDDNEIIHGALEAMVIPLREEMLTAFNKLDEWGQPSTVKIKCRDCNKEVDVKLDLNPVNFFTTRSKPETQL